jgi:hypothetical protein
MAMTALNVSVADTLLMVAVGTVISAWIAQKLHLACD